MLRGGASSLHGEFLLLLRTDPFGINSSQQSWLGGFFDNSNIFSGTSWSPAEGALITVAETLSLLERTDRFETFEAERERLAQAPTGSLLAFLATLPVTIPEPPRNLVIELAAKPWQVDPWNASEGGSHTLVVVPLSYRAAAEPPAGQPRRRFAGSWECAVVYSTDPHRPVGGHRVTISAAELSRGRKLDVGELITSAVAPF